MRALALLCAAPTLALVLSGCPAEVAPAPVPDAGGDAPGGACTSDTDCSNGLFCDGEEQCAPGSAAADPRGCVDGTAPCVAGSCDETADRCGGACPVPDADGDGEPSTACGGTDCDDADPQRAPGRTEICDVADRDEDCDPSTFGFRDIDMDGELDAACCNMDGSELNCGADCDDTRAAVSPTSPEVCNGRDDDCNGSIDEGVLETFYVDADNDQFGVDALPTIEACAAPVGYAADAGDCNDAESGENPAVMERCDPAMRDENCDGVSNPDTLCMCTDGIARGCTLPGACAAGREICAGGTWGPCSIGPMLDVCNGIDDDCDAAVDEGMTVTCYVDVDDDTYAPPGSVSVARCPVPGRGAVGGCDVGYTNRAPGSAPDCDDTLVAVNPGAAEVCDGTDSDCSTGGGLATDEDGDGDLHASISAPCTGGFPRDDCDDAVATTYTGAPELCNRVDDDCSSGGGSLATEDADSDAHSPVGAACSGGFPRDDCSDANASVHPGQALFFSTPYCVNGSTPYACPGFGGLFCDEGGACPPVCGGCTPIPLPTYDYDCDGVAVKMPLHDCPSMSRGCSAAPCRSGPVSAMAACGNSTTFVFCGCGGLTCTTSGSGAGRMGCH